MADGNGLIARHLKEFCAGSFLGGISSGTFLFTAGGNWTHLIGEWVVRLVFTSLIALCSGLATAWAKDMYESYKNYKKQKQKENEREKRRRNSSNGRAA